MFNALLRSERTRRNTEPCSIRYEDLKEQKGIQNHVQYVMKIWKNKKEYKTMFNMLRRSERTRRNTKPCSMHYEDLKEQEGFQYHVQCVTKMWKNKTGSNNTMFNMLWRSERTRRDTKPNMHFIYSYLTSSLGVSLEISPRNYFVSCISV